jgi:hypothetical protein
MKLTLYLTALLASAATQASAASYTYTTISVPGAYATYGRAINDAGTVAGDYTTSARTHCFIFKAGMITSFDPPGSSSCSGEGISADGTVVGTFFVAGTTRLDGFTYKDGVFTTYGHGGYKTELFAESPNGTAIGSSTNDRTQTSRIFEVRSGVELNEATAAYAQQFFYCVNDAGKAAGYYVTTYPGLKKKGLIYRSGDLSSVGLSGVSSILIQGINTAGTTAGSYIDATSGLEHGFVSQHGVMTPVLDPNTEETGVGGINDAGDLVGEGFSTTGVPPEEGFVVLGGVFSVVPPPPVAGIRQFDVGKINNARQLLGGYFDASDDFISFIATPQ